MRVKCIIHSRLALKLFYFLLNASLISSTYFFSSSQMKLTVEQVDSLIKTTCLLYFILHSSRMTDSESP